MSLVDVSLSDIANNLPGFISITGPETSVRDISHDSRHVGPDSLYVAIRGENVDGHRFVSDAVSRGAKALLVEEIQDVDVPQIVVADSRLAMAWAARAVFHEPDTSISIAGVTGTNGKSSVIHMLESILASSGVSVGTIGTLGAFVAGEPIPISRTTPEATDLQRILGTMRDNGADSVVMEVSSHGIELHRSDAIEFSVMGFTNLSQDHLDFHLDMDSYFDVKRRVFTNPPSLSAVINIDDERGRQLAKACVIPVTTTSLLSEVGGASSNTVYADITATNIVVSASQTTFRLVTGSGQSDITLPLVGSFNVSNALVAVGMAMRLGAGLSSVAAGLRAIKPIVGRMEIIDHDGPFTVIVDYAHTPDAIAVVLESCGAAASGRVIATVGAGGDRDRDKRPMMGSAAARFSDIVVVTTDNPRTEDPAAIAEAVADGANSAEGAVVEIILDRREAIQRVVSLAKQGDIVLILGKGHETGQDIGSEVLSFVDQDEVRIALRREGWLRR